MPAIRRKSPLQAIDQPLERLAVAVVDPRRAPKATGVVTVADGFREGLDPQVLVDPAIRPAADLAEHAQQVVRLAVIAGGCWLAHLRISRLGVVVWAQLTRRIRRAPYAPTMKLTNAFVRAA